MSKIIKNRLVAFLITGVVLLACSCSHGEEQPVPELEAVEPEPQEKSRDEISILFTGNMLGGAKTQKDLKAVEDRAAELKNSGVRVDIVDCGNFTGAQKDPEDAEKTVKAMAGAGYSHVVIGDGEFSFGTDGLRRLIDAGGPAFMSCNFRYSGFGEDMTASVARFDVVELGNVRVGYVALTDTGILERRKEDLIEDGRVAYTFCGRSSAYLADTVQACSDMCRNEGADCVVVLSNFLQSDLFGLTDIVGQTHDIDAFLCVNSDGSEAVRADICNGQNTEVPLAIAKGGVGSFGELKISGDGAVSVSFV